MNNSWFEKVMLNFYTYSKDIFGEKSTYHGFEMKEAIQNSTDGLQSDQLQGKILYTDEDGNSHKPVSIFVKLASDNAFASSNSILYSFSNEINFYTKIAPMMGTLDESFFSLFPKFFHGETMFNKNRNESAIFFEDLRIRDYKMTEKKSFLDYQHLALMMRKLGTFHAYSYKAKNATPDLFYPTMSNIFQECNPIANRECNHLLAIIARRGFDLLQQEHKYLQYAARMETLIENSNDIYKQSLNGDRENPTSVITHGDYLRNNLMFRYKNNIPDDLIMIDMATYRYASPVIDLLHVLYMNADQATRDKYWDKLIDEYYTALKETFPDNEVPSKSTIMSDFIGRSFYVYLVASYFLPRLMEYDYDIPLPQDTDLDPDIARKYRERKFTEIPIEMWAKLLLLIGGEKSTQALRDILQDMIDRKFICA
ncbi:uncharacterized protein LOC135848557 [Planococcus citri]|uniref:uncharacterized protein LOC135848557 n=1 Tax=Planococcus citri TaxID=170843 RepID=UPI0031F79BF0